MCLSGSRPRPDPGRWLSSFGGYRTGSVAVFGCGPAHPTLPLPESAIAFNHPQELQVRPLYPAKGL